jgi:hypothetical protein
MPIAGFNILAASGLESPTFEAICKKEGGYEDSLELDLDLCIGNGNGELGVSTSFLVMHSRLA